MNLTPLQYFKKILSVFPEIARQSGYPVPFLAWQFTKGYLRHRVQIDEFRTLRLYQYSGKMFDDYLTWKNSTRISDALNAGATAEEIALFNDKHLFNRHFREFIHRDWLYIPESTPEQIREFITGHDAFLAKACTSTQGNNIFRYTAEELDPDQFLEEYAGKPFLLEAFIRQHPALAAINPSSVNTIRLIVARKDDKVAFVGAGLRSGGGGQFVDNFHHGGTAYPIDLETGIITARGIDLDGNAVLRHPVTGYVMPGFRIPHWDMLLELVRKASVMTPHIGYVGWDLAITEEGVEFIEGNINYPGNNIIQLDGPGAYPRLKAFIKQIDLHI